jgi:hypothetical protein
MYVYILTLIPILYLLYKYVSCKEKENSYDLVIKNYKPERKIDFNKVKNHSQCIIIPFLAQERKYMTHRVFKTVEFTTAEMLIRLCIFKLNTRDEYIQSLINEKIRNLIINYLEVFNYSEELANSLTHKIYMNLCKTELDLFNVLNEVNKQLYINLKTVIDKDIIGLPKNFFWHFNVKYSLNNLVSYIKFVSQNRTI